MLMSTWLILDNEKPQSQQTDLGLSRDQAPGSISRSEGLVPSLHAWFNMDGESTGGLLVQI